MGLAKDCFRLAVLVTFHACGAEHVALEQCPFIREKYRCDASLPKYQALLSKLTDMDGEKRGVTPGSNRTHVLFFGTSHIRQTGTALMCLLSRWRKTAEVFMMAPRKCDTCQRGRPIGIGHETSVPCLFQNATLQPYSYEGCGGSMGKAVIDKNNMVFFCNTDLARMTLQNGMSLSMVVNHAPATVCHNGRYQFEEVPQFFRSSLGLYSHIFWQKPHPLSFKRKIQCTQACLKSTPSCFFLDGTSIFDGKVRGNSINCNDAVGQQRVLQDMGFEGQFIHVLMTESRSRSNHETQALTNSSKSIDTFDPTAYTQEVLNITLCNVNHCSSRGGHQCMPGLPDFWARHLVRQYLP